MNQRESAQSAGTMKKYNLCWKRISFFLVEPEFDEQENRIIKNEVHAKIFRSEVCKIYSLLGPFKR